MAQADDEIAFNTPVGAIKAHGFNVVVILALVILSWLTFTEHESRSHEHEDIIKAIAQHEKAVVDSINYSACLNRLNLYVVTAKDPTRISLNGMPPDLFICLPRFMSEGEQERRKEQGR